MATTASTHKRRATRADVARLADVSTAVVSYVFNNGPRPVAPATAARVRDAAEKLGYRPNSFARALSTGSSKALGIIVPDLSNPFFSGVYGALESTAARNGYSTLFMASHQDPVKETDRISQLIAREVDAIIIASAQPTSALGGVPREDCPFVFMDQTQPVPRAKCVSTDFQTAVRLAVQHLASHGRRRIVMLSGKADEGLDDQRIQGWYRAHEEAGLPTGDVIQARFTRQGGYDAMMSLLDDPATALPEAIFADSDLEAIGALRALHERHVRVPDDIAVVSFDGTVDSQFSWPPLSTVQQDVQGIADRMFQAAIHPQETPDLQLIEPTLTPRQSCGCLPMP